MKTITCEGITISPPIAGDSPMSICLSLHDPSFPIRHGARLILVSARGVMQSFGGEINIIVGYEKHERRFKIQIAKSVKRGEN